MNIITGFHRSGTSALSGALYYAGLPMGNVNDMIGPGRGNPKGHFENRVTVAVNDLILATNGGSWDNPPAGVHRVSGSVSQKVAELGKRSIWVKDPRFCITLPIWNTTNGKPRVIVSMRNPLECLTSLEIRNERKFNIEVWRSYMCQLRNALMDSEREYAVIHYEDLLKDPVKILSFVFGWVGQEITPDAVRNGAMFVENNLRDSTIPLSNLPSDIRGIYDLIIQEGKTYA